MMRVKNLTRTIFAVISGEIVAATYVWRCYTVEIVTLPAPRYSLRWPLPHGA